MLPTTAGITEKERRVVKLYCLLSRCSLESARYHWIAFGRLHETNRFGIRGAYQVLALGSVNDEAAALGEDALVSFITISKLNNSLGALFG